MATKFHFEHRFRAPSTAAVFAAYFDDAHRDEQDRAVDVARREILSDDDTATTRRRVSKVWPRRQLPAVVRAMMKGDLSYDETIVWVKAADRIDFDIRPTLLDGRARIDAAYQLRVDGPGAIVRSAGDRARRAAHNLSRALPSVATSSASMPSPSAASAKAFNR